MINIIFVQLIIIHLSVCPLVFSGLSELAHTAPDLIKAAANGNLDDVKNALTAGQDIDHSEVYNGFPRGSFEGPAIKMAALGGHLETVKFLIEKGANPYLPYTKELIPKIVMDNHHYKRKYIADYLNWQMGQPKILNRFYEDGFTPLGYCISHGYDKKVEELIKLGADVCKMDKNGTTPLMHAIEANSETIVNNLISKGALACGISALDLAFKGSKDLMVEILLKNKPDLVNATFEDGFTPLTRSLAITHNEEVTKFLIENGADPSKTNSNGSTPVELALENDALKIADLLVSQGATVPHELDTKLLHKFAEDGRVDVYKFLIKHKWNKEQTDADGKTSLALSAKYRNLILTEYLIRKGADTKQAKEEIEAFRDDNVDFDYFMENL